MYPQVFGKYVLERELARGGMARVLLATLKGAGGFEKKLVVKQIRDELAYDEFIKRFVEEAKTTVALSHPNIVPVYELGVELGTYFLAMEFVEGVSIAELLRAASREGVPPPSPEQGAYIGVEVCRALDYAHRRMKVVHRDITPRNVMLDEEGQIKVIDFGIAAPADVGGHEVFGSPGHMPPEQSEGKELTAATDVFAVAALLLEVWSGKAPFRRKDAKECEALLRGKHPRPSDMDIRLLPLDDVIASALSLDPLARPQEADELGRALRKFLAGVDLHDLARGLGDRVRSLRAKPAPTPEVKAGLQRPASRGSAAEIRTKTFAARDVVKDWGPEVEETAGTRKLVVSSAPPPASAASALLAPADAIETMATRPLETSRKGKTASPRRLGALTLVLVVGASMLGGFFISRAIKGAALGEVPSATTTPSSTPSATGTATTTATTTTTTPTATTTTTMTAMTTANDAGAATSVDAAVTQNAKLTLQGDTGTVVAVDGASRGACPVTMTLGAGAHSVRFTFRQTGESRDQSIVLKAGESAGMRAEFTGAQPMVRVWRSP